MDEIIWPNDILQTGNILMELFVPVASINFHNHISFLDFLKAGLHDGKTSDVPKL